MNLLPTLLEKDMKKKSQECISSNAADLTAVNGRGTEGTWAADSCASLVPK